MSHKKASQPKLEVWNKRGFARELKQRGVALWKGSYDKSVAAAFIGIRIIEEKGLPEGHVRLTLTDKVVDINVLSGGENA